MRNYKETNLDKLVTNDNFDAIYSNNALSISNLKECKEDTESVSERSRFYLM